MTITTKPRIKYELLDVSGTPIGRTVCGEGTAVILRNAGECSGYRPVQDGVLLTIEPGTTVQELVEWAQAESVKPSADELNEMFAMGEPVADTTNTVAGVVVSGEVFPVDADVEESITAYTGVSLAALRKMASQAGMRTTTGIDPYKQATRDQLIDFLNGGAR